MVMAGSHVLCWSFGLTKFKIARTSVWILLLVVSIASLGGLNAYAAVTDAVARTWSHTGYWSHTWSHSWSHTWSHSWSHTEHIQSTVTVVQPCVGSGCYPYPQPCFGPGCYPCYPYECTPYSYFTPTYAAPTIVAPSVPATLVLTPVTGSGVSNVYVTIVVNPDGQYVATLSAKNLKPSTPYLIEGIPPSGGLPTPLFSTQDESIFTSRADGVGVYSHLMFFDPRIGFSQIFLMDFSTMQIVATVVLS